MELSPSRKADSHSTEQEIPHPNIHYRLHYSLPIVPILIQMNPVHDLTPYL